MSSVERATGPPSWHGSGAGPSSNAIHDRSRMGRSVDTRGQTGMTSDWGTRDATRTQQAGLTAAPRNLHGGKDLGPNRDHAQEQGDRRQRGGFLDNGAKHGVLLNERRT